MAALLSLSFSSNLKELKAGLLAAEKEILPIANAKALTGAAKMGQRAIREEMTRVFDRPTDYTLNSTWIKAATPAVPEAFVYLKRFSGRVSADRYLLPEIDGGERGAKSSEKQLQPLMRGYKFAVPAQLTKLDGFGNLPGSTWMQMLSQLQVANDPLQNQTARSKAKRRRKGGTEYFVPSSSSGLRPGVYQRLGSRAIAPVVIFVAKAAYKERLKFYEVGMAAAQEDYPRGLVWNVEHELAARLPH